MIQFCVPSQINTNKVTKLGRWNRNEDKIQYFVMSISNRSQREFHSDFNQVAMPAKKEKKKK